MIAINNLIKKYDDFVLELSLNIPDGTVSGIVGRNGAGKSTLIKSILGLIRPDGGTVLTMDKDPYLLSSQEKAEIGVAMSDSGFSSYLSINDIVKILRNMYTDFDEENFISNCNNGGLPLGKRISEFSTGMKAKLRVLTACSHNAKLLILDEPTSGLDVVARREILDMLRQYLSEDSRRTMLISSHISSDLEGICDDIYMINNGKIILHEDTDRILGEYAVLKLSDAKYGEIDDKYIVKVKKEKFGYSCLTDQRQFYVENYPDIVIESGSIDDMIIMMTEGD